MIRIWLMAMLAVPAWATDPPAAPAPGQSWVAAGIAVPLRSAPEQGAGTVTELRLNSSIEVLSVSGDWVEVVFRTGPRTKDQGWVSRNQIAAERFTATSARGRVKVATDGGDPKQLVRALERATWLDPADEALLDQLIEAAEKAGDKDALADASRKKVLHRTLTGQGITLSSPAESLLSLFPASKHERWADGPIIDPRKHDRSLMPETGTWRYHIRVADSDRVDRVYYIKATVDDGRIQAVHFSFEGPPRATGNEPEADDWTYKLPPCSDKLDHYRAQLGRPQRLDRAVEETLSNEMHIWEGSAGKAMLTCHSSDAFGPLAGAFRISNPGVR